MVDPSVPRRRRRATHTKTRTAGRRHLGKAAW